MEKRDGPRHNLKVDPSYTFVGVRVKSLHEGCNANPTWKATTPPEQQAPHLSGGQPKP